MASNLSTSGFVSIGRLQVPPYTLYMSKEQLAVSCEQLSVRYEQLAHLHTAPAVLSGLISGMVGALDQWGHGGPGAGRVIDPCPGPPSPPTGENRCPRPVSPSSLLLFLPFTQSKRVTLISISSPQDLASTGSSF